MQAHAEKTHTITCSGCSGRKHNQLANGTINMTVYMIQFKHKTVSYTEVKCKKKHKMHLLSYRFKVPAATFSWIAFDPPHFPGLNFVQLGFFASLFCPEHDLVEVRAVGKGHDHDHHRVSWYNTNPKQCKTKRKFLYTLVLCDVSPENGYM